MGATSGYSRARLDFFHLKNEQLRFILSGPSNTFTFIISFPEQPLENGVWLPSTDNKIEVRNRSNDLS